MNKTSAAYVLDTSALLALIEDEAEADVVQAILEKARTEDGLEYAPYPEIVR